MIIVLAGIQLIHTIILADISPWSKYRDTMDIITNMARGMYTCMIYGPMFLENSIWN